MGLSGDWSRQIEENVGQVVVGYKQPLREMLVGLLAGGHVLLEGVPGIGKTLIVKTLSQVLGLDFKRIQFTPDLMPTDILGTNVFDARTNQFQLRLGPVFTNFLLADEINRTPPRTQAALLEAMEERQVTIDGESHRLPQPFMVFATQNPVEYEGTFPLPEAQLDRFMLKIVLDYPSSEEEETILKLHAVAGMQRPSATVLLDGEKQLQDAMEEVKTIKVEDKIIDYIMRLVRASRENPQFLLGASPRCGVHLIMASKALAALSGRDFVIPDDVKYICPSVLRHRVQLRPEVEMEGYTTDHLLQQMLSTIAVPR